MAPRRTAARTAVNEAAVFDFEAAFAEFERPDFTRSLFRKGKLAPKIKAMLTQLDELDDRIDRLEKSEGEDGRERDITAVNPLAELIRRRDELTDEYNALAEEFNASAAEFTFRVPDDKGDHARIQTLMDESGIKQPVKPEVVDMGDPELTAKMNEAASAEFDKAFSEWWDALAIRSMSVTCVRHPWTDQGAPPMTLADWEALRASVGEVAFNALGSAWFEAVQAAAPSAPFLLRPSPIHDSGE